MKELNLLEDAISNAKDNLSILLLQTRIAERNLEAAVDAYIECAKANGFAKINNKSFEDYKESIMKEVR